jgi:hypothetical protein
MLAVSSPHRGRGIATALVRRAIDAMISREADEIALETETSNAAAMKLYERLGFLRSKRLHRYYLNGNSAYRLVLYLREGVGRMGLGDWEGGYYAAEGEEAGEGERERRGENGETVVWEEYLGVGGLNGGVGEYKLHCIAWFLWDETYPLSEGEKRRDSERRR